MVAALHRRAAAWYEADGLPERAIEHAQRAGDADRVERLVLDIANPVWASGRLDTVLRWIAWFSDNRIVEKHPAVAVHGSLMYALIGKAGEADRWAALAERTEPVRTFSDGNTMEGLLAYLRALLCRDGFDEMRNDAQLAIKGLSPTSPYRVAMLHAEGIAALYEDEDLDEADAYFARAVDKGKTTNLMPFIPVVLAERGLVAIERDDWDQAETMAAQAMTIMERGHFDEYWTSAFVYAWAARVAAHGGDVTRRVSWWCAPHDSVHSSRTPSLSCRSRRCSSWPAPLALADPGGALAALRQIADSSSSGGSSAPWPIKPKSCASGSTAQG